jgi:tetratricopeptide (TPR) repeat protein
MAIDRDATLRKAEKFLRQGRLDNAIGEYLRVVEENPRDWSTVNVVGDLLVRAGQIESANEHFTRIADHFFEEGFLPRAAAVYKKILKLRPDAEHAQLRTAEIFEKQGLLADAKTALANVAERRLKRGDRRGAGEVQVRISALDPADLAAGLAAAKAAGELGDSQGAVERLFKISSDFQERGKLAESLQALDEAVRLDPENADVRTALVGGLIQAGELDRASNLATSAREFKTIAAELYARGRADQALSILERALAQDPGDTETRSQLVRSFIGSGELDRARKWLTGEVTDPEMLLSLAEIELASGHGPQGRDLLQRVLQREPSRREQVVLLGCRLCETQADAAFECIDLASDAAVADHDWPAAASALHEYTTRVSGHIPALMKLVEVCVDGGLEATMYTAQAELADAYLLAGRPNEARVIAEDLVAREPWERANIERFRRALIAMGEADPDAVVADRLSGDSPFMSIDLGFDLNEIPGADEALPRHEAPATGGVFKPGPESIDLTSILGSAAAGRPDAADGFEIDLSDALGEIGGAGAAPAPAGGTQELERVFEDFREEASRHGKSDAAGQQFRLGLMYRDAGQVAEAIKALQQAVRSPRHRFEAAAQLARLHRDRGAIPEAIEWLERATQAAAPSAAAGHDVLYDLAQLLVSSGEADRALAVFLELQADAPDFRDVSLQIERLSQKA